MYDPKLGRFTAEDPIGFRGGDVNRYAYVWNNPLNHTDPFGLDGWGNDWADYFDAKIEFARQFWKPQEEGDPDWITNGINNSVADVAHGSADMLRCGSGIGQAFSNDENGYGVAAFIAMDVSRCSALFATLAGPFSGRAGGSNVTPEACQIDKFNRTPQSLMDQMVMEAAKRGEGKLIEPNLGDSRFKGMEKWSYGETSAQGFRSEVHYVRNPATGDLMDFKFKHSSIDKNNTVTRLSNATKNGTVVDN